ncbi:MAG: flagellar protein [Lachnospiraceae bacterium]|nr:flagellar protein [Lachnospiraceae bacterium]
MEVRSCPGCGKLFNYLGSTTPACPACMAAREEKFQICKEYIRQNPGANISKVAEDTEVSVKLIKQWVREERLTFAEGSSVGIECERCGANILTGRFCNACKGNMTQSLNNAAQSLKPVPEPVKADPRESAKMRFLNGDK